MTIFLFKHSNNVHAIVDTVFIVELEVWSEEFDVDVGMGVTTEIGTS